MENMAEKDLDGDAGVTFPGCIETFSAPNRFGDLMWLQSEYLTGGAPWFNKDHIAYPEYIDAYAIEDGILPGDMTPDAVTSWSWSNQFAVEDDELAVPQGKTLQFARVCYLCNTQSELTRLYLSLIHI